MEELSHILSNKPYPIGDKESIDTGAPLIMKHNTCSIVAGVCIKDNKVLLMQEAKTTCHGLWYLPAGRMERGESILEGCVREVKEETGMIVKPLSLIVVECITSGWQRFTFACEVVGGDLKTTAQADKESLQAGWFPVDTYQLEVKLRAGDIVQLIYAAMNWFKSENINIVMPGNIPYTSFVVRLVCICEVAEKLHVLLTDNKHLVAFKFPNYCSLNAMILDYLSKFLNENKIKPEILGVLAVDHTGTDGIDGCCLSVLVRIVHTIPHSGWYAIADVNLKAQLVEAIKWKIVALK